MREGEGGKDSFQRRGQRLPGRHLIKRSDYMGNWGRGMIPLPHLTMFLREGLAMRPKPLLQIPQESAVAV